MCSFYAQQAKKVEGPGMSAFVVGFFLFVVVGGTGQSWCEVAANNNNDSNDSSSNKTATLMTNQSLAGITGS